MIRVFVISLPDCFDRRKKITRNLKFLGIPFEFIDAIDGRNGLLPEYENQINRVEAVLRGRMPSDAEFACALSHVKVYRRIVDEKIPWSLILEDDAIPQKDLVQFLQIEHWKNVQFTQLVENGMPLYVIKKSRKRVFGNYNSYLYSIGHNPPAGAYGYIISKKAAQFIFENGVPVTNEADWPYCISRLIQKKEFRIIYPPLIHHPEDNSSSLIDPYRQNSKKSKKRFLGIYIPPKRAVIDTITRSYHKLFATKINDNFP